MTHEDTYGPYAREKRSTISTNAAGTPSNQPSSSTGLGSLNRAPVSPHTAPPTDYPSLTPAEQQAQDYENSVAIQQAQGEIAIDSGSEYAESDPGYATDSIRTATTSLSSSLREFEFENGRRYHKFRSGQYNFPNDPSEQDREDMKHAVSPLLAHLNAVLIQASQMVVMLCQTLHFAPIGPNPQNVMDMGTGTGIWAIESESF